MSLSILVTVEMFNAMNSLSENESLLRLPLWKNMFLVAAITLSMVLHVLILYVPFLTVSRVLHNRFHLVDDSGRQSIFAIVPLDWIEWKAVLWLSAPVLLIDEVLKLLSVRLYLFFLAHFRALHDSFLDIVCFTANQGQIRLGYRHFDIYSSTY
jgi:P-type Ca2+ transporter type 2A